MFASAICVRAGAASQAAFEIIRQVSLLVLELKTNWCRFNLGWRQSRSFTSCSHRSRTGLSFLSFCLGQVD
jgi:hypothetical protein